MTWLHRTALAIALAVAPSCGDGSRPGAPSPSEGPPVVATTTAILFEIASRLGGDDVRVVAPIPMGQDPAWWKPSGEEIAAFQRADLVLANGARYERWLDRANLPRSRLVKTTALVREPLLKVKDASVHSHGPGGAHSHEGIDGHTFVDPTLLRDQAEAARRALKALVPAAAGAIDERHAALDKDLSALADALAAIERPAEGEAIVASHPVYGYLARRLGWSLVNLDWVPDVVPDGDALAEAERRLAGRRPRAILWPSPPRADVQAKVAERFDAPAVVFPIGDTLGVDDRAAGRGAISALQAGIERLAGALR